MLIHSLDTIEKNILDLAAKRGLSLYTKENAVGTLNTSPFANEANKETVDAPSKKKDQKGDFISKWVPLHAVVFRSLILYRIDDMLAILFPHMYEEERYLIPDGVEDVEDDVVMEEAQPSMPVAGPSRRH